MVLIMISVWGGGLVRGDLFVQAYDRTRHQEVLVPRRHGLLHDVVELPLHLLALLLLAMLLPFTTVPLLVLHRVGRVALLTYV